MLFQLSLASSTHCAPIHVLLTPPCFAGSRVQAGFKALCFSAVAVDKTPEQSRVISLLEKLRSRQLKNAQNVAKLPSKRTTSPDTKSPTVSSFAEMELAPETMSAINELNISVPTEVQCLGIPAILGGQSIVLASHTGSGKTLAYMLPLVQEQRERWTEAAYAAVEVLSEELRPATEAARPEDGWADRPYLKIAVALDPGNWTAMVFGEQRGNDLAIRICLFYDFSLSISRLWPWSIYSRSQACNRSVSKVNRSASLCPVPGARDCSEIYQIFIKLPSGKSFLVWVNILDTVEVLRARLTSRVEALRANIASCMGNHANDFYLVHAGKSMQDSLKLSDYQISRNSSISLLFRLRGGAVGNQRGPIPSNKGVGNPKNRGTAGPSSYKDAARIPSQPKGPHASADPLPTQPGPYIVEKLDDIPALEVKNTEVKNLFNTLQTHALVCRFNGYWPRSFDLHNWISSNWTKSCQVLLCSKGFFVVQLESQEDYQKILMQGPWFWGRAGLFITPWFPEFDADTMVVTKMPVWVRLPNLPLPFWHPEVLEDIGNRLGKYIISDEERREQGLFTYARICVEIDLSKGLPDKIQLQHESYKRIQALDYENTAFRCRTCHQTGHLNDSCPHARRFPNKKKGPNSKGKTWQAEYEPSINEVSEYEESDMEGSQQEEEPEEAVHSSETREAKNSDTEKADPKKDGTGPQNTSGSHKADSLSGTQTALVIHEVAPSSGVKRGHESEKSDSDKEVTAKQKPELVNGREVVIATTAHGRWVEVKNKKKGKKGKIEAFYQP